MAYELVFTPQYERDQQDVLEHLVDSYVGFGEDVSEAFRQADQRIAQIRADIRKLKRNPRRGTLHDDIRPGLRHVTFGRAIVWFDVNEDKKRVRILAVFFGGQDHVRHMLVRMLSGQ
ncbi:MAG: plasmid stabilization protein [Hirschia sp.]|nr:plasmid stabilization protein [Hirschia sp.]MBF18722.1 plasmid stabilization protein [Hirschia sp.]|tara:strand:- start:701 stop:1051 length:351 start_codon:yes stop_codon:yes gene_type:complete